MSAKLPLLLLCLVFMPAWAADAIDDYYFTLTLEELLAVDDVVGDGCGAGVPF